jgi:hypothetical protein
MGSGSGLSTSPQGAVIGTDAGAVTSTCLAFLGHPCGLDTDAVRAGQLNNGQAPFRAGLPELLKATQSTGRLQFTDYPAEACRLRTSSSCAWEPTGPTGHRTLSSWRVLSVLAPYLRADAVIVNKSTVPVGSGTGRAPFWKMPWGTTVLPRRLQLGSFAKAPPSTTSYPDRIVLEVPPDVGRVAELAQRCSTVLRRAGFGCH